MIGIEGPFVFEIDQEGTHLPWSNINEQLKKELLQHRRQTEKNMSVYLTKICAAPSDRPLQRHHDWTKVKKLFIQVKPGSRRISIGGIYPTTQKTNISDQQTEAPYLSSTQGSFALFELLRFKLKVDGRVKFKLHKDNYKVMSNFTSKFAQWIYTESWEGIGFEHYLYVLVPNSLHEDERFLNISIQPTLKKLKTINNALVWNREIKLPKK